MAFWQHRVPAPSRSRPREVISLGFPRRPPIPLLAILHDVMRAGRAGMTRRRNREVVEFADVSGSRRQRAYGKVTFDGHITARQTVRSSVTSKTSIEQ